MDFAIIEDRKFKSGPKGKIPQQGPRPDHIINPEYDPRSIDVPGLSLLGERQLTFLNEWGENWTGVKMKAATRRFRYGKHEVTLETGRIARQSSGAVLASMGDTSVLVKVVASRELSNRVFFPLTVVFSEMTYSAGRIPRGFFAR